MAFGEDGLRVIDISDPENPVEIGAFDTQGASHYVAVNGDHAYVADARGGLRIINVSNPENPDEVSSIETQGVTRRVTIYGELAYIADGGGGLRIIDVSDSHNPEVIGQVDTPGITTDVKILGNFAFATTRLGGLRVIDISDPTNPREVDYYETPGQAESVTILDDYAIVCDYLFGLRVFDISEYLPEDDHVHHVPGEFDTIQEAINAANEGDEIIVAGGEGNGQNGEYVESIDFDGKNIRLIGDPEHPENVVIDGNGEGSVVVFINGETEDAVLNGFTLSNGSGHIFQQQPRGGGIFLHGNCSPIITNCIISDNHTRQGGGIYCLDGPSPTVSNCIIRNNTTTQSAGGVFIENASPILDNCVINLNVSGLNEEEEIRIAGGIYLNLTGARLNNCIIQGNRSHGHGGGISIGRESDAVLVNCTISDNTAEVENAETYGGGILNVSSRVIIESCIISNNSATNGGGIFSQGPIQIENCQVIGNEANLDGGGLWFGGVGSNGARTLRCLVANNICNNEQDLGGGGIAFNHSNALIENCTIVSNSGFENQRGGIGIWESSPTIRNTIIWGNTGNLHQWQQNNQFLITYSDIEGGCEGVGNLDTDPLFLHPDEGDYHLQGNSPCIDAGDPESPEDPDGTRVDMGAFYFAPDDDGILHVPGEYETIQAAIDATDDGDEIIVAADGGNGDNGEYVENIDFSGKDIVVIGDPDNPEDVVIDGGGEGSVVTFENGESEDAVLTGFTIRNGSGSIINFFNEDINVGGGIKIANSSPTILNCIVTENRAFMYGGGICGYNSNSEISNCKVSRNRSENYGGGIFFVGESSPIISYSEFSLNICQQGGGVGCYYNAAPQIINCTFSENEASDWAGSLFLGRNSHITISNSILWNNQPEEVGFYLHNESSTLTISYSDIQNGLDGILLHDNGEVIWSEGNIDLNPLLADIENGDFHLTENSPCINTGDPESDLDPDDTRADMGAYYFHHDPPVDPPEVEWSRAFGGEAHEDCNSVIQTRDGGYALAGYTYSWGEGNQDGWLIITDENGQEIWSETYGGGGFDRFYSVIQTDDGGYVLAGMTNSSGAGDYDMWLMRVNANGEEIWSRTYGGEQEEGCYEAIRTADGGFALAGHTHSFGEGGRDWYLIKTDEDGNELWTQTFGGEQAETCYGIVQIDDGGFALTGVTISFGNGANDYYLVRTDNEGNEQWSNTYGGEGNDYCLDIVNMADGGFALSGSGVSFGQGGHDFSLVRTDENGEEIWAQTYGEGGHEIDPYLVQFPDGGFALAGETNSIGEGVRLQKKLDRFFKN